MASLPFSASPHISQSVSVSMHRRRERRMACVSSTTRILGAITRLEISGYCISRNPQYTRYCTRPCTSPELKKHWRVSAEVPPAGGPSAGLRSRHGGQFPRRKITIEQTLKFLHYRSKMFVEL